MREHEVSDGAPRRPRRLPGRIHSLRWGVPALSPGSFPEQRIKRGLEPPSEAGQIGIQDHEQDECPENDQNTIRPEIHLRRLRFVALLFLKFREAGDDLFLAEIKSNKECCRSQS